VDRLRGQRAGAGAHRLGLRRHAACALLRLLADAGAADAGVQAAIERVTAARMQREARLEERSRQLRVLHDAAQAALLRQQQIGQLLEQSDLLRRATREQWARLGRRSLFDLISAENDHAQLQIARAQAEHEHLMALLQMQAAGAGLRAWLAPFRAEPAPR
jgi:adhesin transport system outer membrane protein